MKEKDLGKYIVYSNGTVFSKSRNKYLTAHFNKITGYCQFQLGNKRILSHRLIAISFIPNPNNYPQVNHINRIKTDNREENLEWCTGSYNTIDAYRAGLAKGPKGIMNGQSKLNDYKVKCIRWLYKHYPKRYSHSKMGKLYGVSQAIITHIVRRETWKHVI